MTSLTMLFIGVTAVAGLLASIAIWAPRRIAVKLGALSLVTNLAPAGLAYGTWALINGTIDLSASVVMCMSIGIVVDDTVHFLSKYRRARFESGADPANALEGHPADAWQARTHVGAPGNLDLAPLRLALQAGRTWAEEQQDRLARVWEQVLASK